MRSQRVEDTGATRDDHAAGGDMKRLCRWILVYSLAGSICLMAVTALLCILPLRAQVSRAARQCIAREAELRALEMGGYIRSVQQCSCRVARDARVRTLLQTYLKGELDEADYRNQSRQRLEHVLELMEDVAGIVLCGPQGEPLTSGGETFWQQRIPAMSLPQSATGVVLGPPFEHRDNVYLMAHVPLTDPTDGRLGTAVLCFSGQRFIDLLVRRSGEISCCQVRLVLEKEGVFTALCVNPSTNEISRWPVDDNSSEALRRVSTGSPVIIETPSPDGEMLLTALNALPGCEGWALQVRAPRESLYRGVQGGIGMTLVGIAGIGIVGTLGMVVLIRPLTRHALLRVQAAEDDTCGTRESLRDETDRRRALEERLRTTEKALRQTDEELVDFAYMVSHDLQEPLRTCRSFAHLLSRRYKGKLDDDGDDFIDFIVDGAERGKDLINGLLDYSRVTTRGREPMPVSSYEVVADVLANLRYSIDKSNAKVEVASLPTVLADEAQSGCLFRHLISNALTFRRKGVPPRIYIAAAEMDASQQSPGDEDESYSLRWLFSVRDNGRGISPKDQHRMFTIFQRVEQDTGGAGVGLAVCKRIVQRHGGRIWVESEVGKGSTFFFTLPGIDVEARKKGKKTDHGIGLQTTGRE
ncbi:MAG: hypothetical protein K9N51_08460 [Candidatus Pacebacteria bacterium]|nr:hypothetical protein [Candidatus Paceibacterota bacterium]